MNRLDCKPFGKEHIEAAKLIALDNYREERESVPELPEDTEIWDMYEYAARYLAQNNIKVLGVCLYAHDEISKKALFEYGFGMFKMIR